MTDFFFAISIFLLIHLIPAVRPLRVGLARVFGERGYIFLFSGVSIALTFWLGWAYSEAPYQELWPYQEWARQLVLGVMLFACILIVAGLSSANPFSLTMTGKVFDPAQPGIVALTRHPPIWGLGIWSGSHVLVNGDLASVVLFGLLTLLCVVGPFSVEKRRRRAMGDEAWQVLGAEIIKTSLPGILVQIGIWRLVGGLCLYGSLLYLHETVIGVSPLAG